MLTLLPNQEQSSYLFLPQLQMGTQIELRKFNRI